MVGGMTLPTTKEVEIKEKQIIEAQTRRVNDKDINHMIKEKERFMENPKNYAMFKSRLIKERDIALQTGHEDNADKLSKRIDEIEARAEKLDASRTQKISSIALINDKNRRQNIERAEAGIRQEMERKKREGEVSVSPNFCTYLSLSLQSVVSTVDNLIWLQVTFIFR